MSSCSIDSLEEYAACAEAKISQQETSTNTFWLLWVVIWVLTRGLEHWLRVVFQTRSLALSYTSPPQTQLGHCWSVVSHVLPAEVLFCIDCVSVTLRGGNTITTDRSVTQKLVGFVCWTTVQMPSPLNKAFYKGWLFLRLTWRSPYPTISPFCSFGPSCLKLRGWCCIYILTVNASTIPLRTWGESDTSVSLFPLLFWDELNVQLMDRIWTFLDRRCFFTSMLLLDESPGALSSQVRRRPRVLWVIRSPPRSCR